MQVIILCGGEGSRLSEETSIKPKPMVEIGQKPILWHIMKIYSHFGFNKFVLALGYKATFVKEYFHNLRFTGSDFTLRLTPNSEPVYFNEMLEKDWEITFVDTGEKNLKGSRIKQLEKYITGDDFFLTYGDGVSDVNLHDLLAFHQNHGKLATLTAVHPPSRFGEIDIDGTLVTSFDEKPQMETGYINGGFFVFKRALFDHLSANPDCDLEFGPLNDIAQKKELHAFRHDGFWQCMDNVREKNYLTRLVEQGKAPWIKV
ncbi:MAG TPA: glucose-1-phosphate cytidylyltransferase [Niabella sp.]|nr:glucose-1-phosphate cytidylyltransferase [Niabella sp.]HOZ97346.1 glucose-1-phosphate cytidylyltransferase [Niabella sp.]HQW15383.1 glucose-1-phosphate cytidylyltransferase [Niabella sp.]HQX20571.1 glucose-1-phosphate cytidylyltransferase [Niabella sp.]HQX40956.1 glucose-1-phosphate cytidylyltransferase [Niabella sp.]